MLISIDQLKILLARIDSLLNTPVDLLLVGGSAVLVLSPRAMATKDLDAFPTDTLLHIQTALAKAQAVLGPVDLNVASATFETYLPEDWQTKTRSSREFSTRNIRVFTPAPEDLAIMKIFRYLAKDAEDVALLAERADFDREAFYNRFQEVLPTAVGDTRWHAQSFSLAWNALYPGDEITIEQVLETKKGKRKRTKKT